MPPKRPSSPSRPPPSKRPKSKAPPKPKPKSIVEEIYAQHSTIGPRERRQPVVRGGDRSVNVFAYQQQGVVRKDSVLVRPTARTKWFKAQKNVDEDIRREKERKERETEATEGREKAEKAEREDKEKAEMRDVMMWAAVMQGLRREPEMDAEQMLDEIATLKAEWIEFDDGGDRVGMRVDGLSSSLTNDAGRNLCGAGGDVQASDNAEKAPLGIMKTAEGSKIPKDFNGMPTTTIGLHSLPQELRDKIWADAVMLPTSFVWPSEKTGAEQPDLAMTCQKIREEVLPIFYARNTFAFSLAKKSKSLSRSEMVKQKQGRRTVNVKVESPGEIEKWAAALTTKGWFGMIRKWAFKLEPVPADPFIISVTGGMSMDDRTLLVSLSLMERPGGYWDLLGGVQIHRTAWCVLASGTRRQECYLQSSPKWLNDCVVAMLDEAKGGDVTASMIVELATKIQEGNHGLVEYKCLETGV